VIEADLEKKLKDGLDEMFRAGRDAALNSVRKALMDAATINGGSLSRGMLDALLSNMIIAVGGKVER
jgi:hypothetical protein